VFRDFSCDLVIACSVAVSLKISIADNPGRRAAKMFIAQVAGKISQLRRSQWVFQESQCSASSGASKFCGPCFYKHLVPTELKLEHESSVSSVSLW